MVLSGDYSVTNYRSQVDRAASIEKIAETGQSTSTSEAKTILLY